jgi:hypothetical protein
MNIDKKIKIKRFPKENVTLPIVLGILIYSRTGFAIK